MAVTLSAQTPAITAVLDGAGVTANLAPGSVFLVKGTGLSASGFVGGTAPAYPTILNSVQITLTPAAGGTALQMLMVYTYNDAGVNQLAAVIQSTVAPGAYDVRVVNGAATSAAFRTTVVPRKPGIVTSDGSGVGIAQATLEGKLILQRNSVMGKIGDFDTRPAHPGDRMDLWGTGLGADVAADTGGSSGDQTAAGQIRVVLNGADIVPLYAGRSQGFPGLDQIVFTIPDNVALKCDNTVQVRAGGVLSNVVTIATSAASATACPPSTPGGGSGACPARANSSTSDTPTKAEVDEWAASGQNCSGSFSVSRLVSYETDFNVAGNPVKITRKDTAAATFTKVTGSDLTRLLNNTTPPPGYLIPAPGVCNMFSLNIVNPYPNLMYVYLDAGNPLTLLGPNGTRNVPTLVNSGNIGYYAEIGAGTRGDWMDPGAYTFTGPGSSTVGSFSVSATVPTEFVVTNPTALSTVNRSAGLTVTWTGGDSSTLVFISGSSYVTSSTGTSVTGAAFQCYESNTAGRFTVPLSVLQQLPASGSISAGTSTIFLPGSVAVNSISKSVRGQASGLDTLGVTSSYNYSFTTLYQ